MQKKSRKLFKYRCISLHTFEGGIMRNVLIFLLSTMIFIVFFTGQLSQSQVETEKFHFVIAVSCLHETTKNEIESYVKRELRKLGDVEINKDYAYTHGLDIHAYKNLITGTTSISFILVEYFDRIQSLKPYLPEKQLEAIRIQMIAAGDHNPPIYIESRLRIHNPQWQELSDICKEVIVDYDVKYLEKIREKR